MSRFRRFPERGRCFDGFAAAEFGLASLLLFTMFLGTIDLGRAVFQRQELTNAVREGARFAMVDEAAREGGSLVSEVASAAAQRSPSLGLQATNFQSDGGGQVLCEEWVSGDWTTVSCTSADAGSRLTVCAGYTFQPIATRLLHLGPITMSDCSRVTIQ